MSGAEVVGLNTIRMGRGGIEGSLLQNYRQLGNSGLRVSPLCLGTMTFGTEWGWGADAEQCQKMFRLYTEAGGNFIDTANKYTEGASENIIGDLIAGKRERLVLATKYTLSMAGGDPNACGNHRKNMVQSIEASLRRLKTDYIDLFYVHAWDGITPIAEVMRALDDLVRSGKVLYLGISDMPAWKVAQANTLAELRGWSSFVSLQAQYNLLERTPERDLIPMAAELGLAVMPWSPLAGGVLSVKPGDAGKRSKQALGAREQAIVDVLAKIANQYGVPPAHVAMRWLSHKDGVTSILVGARTPQQLEENISSLALDLSEAHITELDEVSKVAAGFPHDFLASDMVRNLISGSTHIIPWRKA